LWAVRCALSIECEAERYRRLAAVDDVSERQQLCVRSVVSGGGWGADARRQNGATSSTAGTGTWSALSTISNGSRMTRSSARRLLDEGEVGSGRRVRSSGRFIFCSINSRRIRHSCADPEGGGTGDGHPGCRGVRAPVSLTLNSFGKHARRGQRGRDGRARGRKLAPRSGGHTQGEPKALRRASIELVRVV
jgi:hypothetical protein